MIDSTQLSNSNTFVIYLLPILYAEIHYRFKYFFSYLKKNEPEIIADLPSRIKQGDSLPVLIIIKDANRYPIQLQSVEIYENKIKMYTQEINIPVTDPFMDKIVYIDSNIFPTGNHCLEIKINYKQKGKNKFCFADNHRGTSHKGLPIYISSDPLPCFENCLLGETHSHSNYTSDQVEFGASLSAAVKITRALGLNFFCVTDHSYDLDDHLNDYLNNDPDLNKWKIFKEEVKEINRNNRDVLIIPGEEVTVRNSNGKNVHILVYNSEKYFPGSGDSGEKWFRNRSELSIPDLISQLANTTAVFAAHPVESPPLLQRIFINRGIWEATDCQVAGIDGLQFINGGEEEYNVQGKRLWINQILQGHRLTGLAGDDAHGNFARFRQVGFPFFTMRENYLHLFGKWWTGVYLDSLEKDIDHILSMIKKGNCYLSSGPAIKVALFCKDKWYPMGSSCTAPEQLRLNCLSSDEFSEIEHIQVFTGDIEQKREYIYFEEMFTKAVFNYENDIDLKSILKNGYIRVEVNTVSGHQALSNPIWF